MDETTNLGFDIRARILPQIEGVNELAQNLQNIPNQITQQVGGVVSSPGFQQGLSPQQIQQIPEWLKYNAGIFEGFNGSIKDIIEDLNVDLSTGSLTKAQVNKYIRKFERMKFGAGQAGEDMVGDASDFLRLDKEHLEMIRAAIQDAKGDVGNNIDFLKQKLQDISKGFKDTGNEAQSFYDTLKKAGIFGAGYLGVNSVLSYIRSGAEIEARGMTAFDLTSPMGMYSQEQRFQTFETVQNRQRDYQLAGTIIGMIAGSFGGPLGMAAGGAGGGMIAGQIANIMGIPETAQTEEQLKFLNQNYGMMSNAVGAASNYDVLRARLRARLGRGALGSLGLGYAPEEEMAMRASFADTLGTWNKGLYGEQTTFATAMGLSPQEIYQLNLSGRVTGTDYDIGGLRQGQQFARELYGPGVNPERIVDVLNAIKEINEKQLQLNINADAKNGNVFASIPELLFGKTSPYGRISDLGNVTLANLQDIMQPRSDAQLSFLFRAMGTNNIESFNEMMKGGIYSGNNLIRILNQIRADAGGNAGMAYWELNSLMPNAPEGMIPELRDIITGGRYITRNKTDQQGNLVLQHGKPVTETVWMTLDRFEEELKAKTKAINDSNLTEEEKVKKLRESREALIGFTNEAKNAKSETEKMMAEIKAKQNEIADAWRTLVFKMQSDWLEGFRKISADTDARAKLTKEFLELETKALDFFKREYSKMGIKVDESPSISPEFKKKASEFNPYNGLMENSGNAPTLTDQLSKLGIVMDTVGTVIGKLNDNLDKGIKVVYPGMAPDIPVHAIQNSVAH